MLSNMYDFHSLFLQRKQHSLAKYISLLASEISQKKKEKRTQTIFLRATLQFNNNFKKLPVTFIENTRFSKLDQHRTVLKKIHYCLL